MASNEREPWTLLKLIFSLLWNGPAFFGWILALALIAFPPIYLAYRPQDYTPIVETMLNVFLFGLAYWIGYKREVASAAQKANDRWLPQAESVIFRLLTLQANVRRFSHTTKSTCSTAECDLPELAKDEMRAIRIKLKTDCEASGQRLDDIAHQLEDATDDWARFIGANCAGDECERIFLAIEQRRTRLEADLALTPYVPAPATDTIGETAGI